MSNSIGSVTLVGAGCNYDLITLKGLRKIQNADVLVYDDLIDPDILNEKSENCELIYVGKRSGKHMETQEEIQKILIHQAKCNKKVVRLKGGDSFVFGRGGEEALALLANDIPFEVVPGVSSGIAVPENLGIPVTHRGVSGSVTFVTGHRAENLSENYEVLSKLDGTIVIFMGLSEIGKIGTKLIENGMNPDTPTAILCEGFRSGQKRIDGFLRELSEMAVEAKTPALVVIGKTAAMDLRCPGFPEQYPLSGIRITVTGTEKFTEKLASLLREKGAYVIRRVSISTKYIKNSIPKSFDKYTWLAFTSSNGVQIFFENLLDTEIDLRQIMHLKFACIGDGTAQTLRNYGFAADFVPSAFTAGCLGRELSELLKEDDRLLILRAQNGSDELTQELENANISFDNFALYSTCETSNLIENQDKSESDYVVFASAMGAAAYLKNYTLANEEQIVCIGEQTARVIRKQYPEKELIIPTNHTAKAIVEVIVGNSKK